MDLLRAVKSGEVPATSLGADERRACVEYLSAEGYSVAEMASLLKVGDRTVLRDRQRVREANSVARDPALVGEMVGRLLSEAETAAARLRRIARERETPAATRVEAERACWHIARDLVSSLQRLGYLPMAVVPIQADFTHRVGPADAPEIQDMLDEASRLEEILRTSPVGALISPPKQLSSAPSKSSARSPATQDASSTPPDALSEIEAVRGELARMALGVRLRRVSNTLAKEGHHHERDEEDEAT